MGNVVETPVDVSFEKPLRSRPVALHSAERRVAATMRAEPVAMVREVRLKVRLQNGAT
jgi:hypothetical protein